MVRTLNHQEPTSIDEASELAVRRSIRVRRRPEYYIGASVVRDGLEEPATVKEAFSSREKDEWEKAMEMEMQSLRDNDVWELVEPPKDRKVVGSKWVFKVKPDNGHVEHYKARLVAQGYTQQKGACQDGVTASNDCYSCTQWLET